jgi:hypothetical protein
LTRNREVYHGQKKEESDDIPRATPINALDRYRRSADCQHWIVWIVAALIVHFAGAAVQPAKAAGQAANVDVARIAAADQDPSNWLTYGRTYASSASVHWPG